VVTHRESDQRLTGTAVAATWFNALNTPGTCDERRGLRFATLFGWEAGGICPLHGGLEWGDSQENPRLRAIRRITRTVKTMKTGAHQSTNR
jgi:hypothetical protein